MNRARIYRRMLLQWARLLAGRSYWHAEQELGRCFDPKQLSGYYNDLTAKTAWDGKTDPEGLPIQEDPQGRLIHFPTTVLQKGLGHWDRWILSEERDDQELAHFMCTADWARASEDGSGGWPLWSQLGLSHASPYSAMTQGEGASLLVRAARASQDSRYLDAARRALDLMLRTVEAGGTSRHTEEGIVLEEVPRDPPCTILNGWVFAVFGLHDFRLVEQDPTVADDLADTLAALAASLPGFDAGYWSLYDSGGSLASPFYQALHVAQLDALARTFESHAAVFASYRDTFNRQLASRGNRARAIAAKVIQKLRSPPDVVLSR